MTSARDDILNRLRAARRPFPDAPARPHAYLPVTGVGEVSPDALLARFTTEVERLRGQVHPVRGDAAARDTILGLLRDAGTTHILAWDFRFIPVEGLEPALAEAGIRVTFPDLRAAPDRAAHAADIETAGAGLIGADAVAASTGTLVVSTAPGRGRAPTILPPVLIAVVTPDQFVPRVEDWLAAQRAAGMPAVGASANLAFISGPSRTGDIEMELVLGVHGPGIVHVVVKQ